MEKVLDVYKRPYDPEYPVWCMDETSKQLIEEITKPIVRSDGTVLHDYEYKRNGTRNIFMAYEPLAGKRILRVTRTRTIPDWVAFMLVLLAANPKAKKITIVLDNLNTHREESFYRCLPPAQAREILERIELVFTPEHGSWLNIAEMELAVLCGQCLDRRIPTEEILASEITAWECDRNNLKAKTDWQFTKEDARIKLKRLYPTILP